MITIFRNKSNKIVLDQNVTNLIKFLSSVMIALHHYSQYMVKEGTHNPIYQMLSTQGGWLGVAIFFFLSGYGLMKSDLKNHQSPICFFKKRFQKVYIPAVVISIVWGVFLQYKYQSNIVIGDVLWQFNDGVFWFVRAVVCLYLIFYIYIVVRKYIVEKYRFLLLITIAIISTSALFLMGIVPYPVHASSVLLFFLGVLLAEYPDLFVNLIQKKFWVVFILAFIFVLTLLFRHNHQIVHCTVNYMITIIAITFFSLFEVKISNMPIWIGGCSYDIYLVHNKAKMLLLSYMNFAPLWSFLALTMFFAFLYYNFRKLVNL